MSQGFREATVQIAQGAGRLLREAFGRAGGDVSSKTTRIDLVTDADRASESFILGEIKHHFPGHAVLAEESGATGGTSRWRWVVDPLDGTVNFAHRIPVFCVLIAVQEERVDGSFQTVLGVTHDPMLGETFVAERGGGATLNGREIRVSETRELIDAIAATGFEYDRLFRADDNHREFCRLNLLTQGVRRLGSAGLDLAYVASGRLDGLWEYGLRPWDVEAGVLLVAEAGGRVSNVDGKVRDSYAGSVLASNGHLHPTLIEVIAEARRLPPGSRLGLPARVPNGMRASVPDVSLEAPLGPRPGLGADGEQKK